MDLRRGVSTPVFAGTVVVLVVIAAVGFGLYLTKSASANPMTETATETTTATSGATSVTQASQFEAMSGQMFHTGWLLIQATPSGMYALSIHVEGLETTAGTGNVYIVEAEQSTGAMSVVPIGPNATASEFEVGSDGVGNFFLLLSQNPGMSFESVEVVFLQGMQMSGASVVATASVPSM
jgi:hypothetical protein